MSETAGALFLLAVGFFTALLGSWVLQRLAIAMERERQALVRLELEALALRSKLAELEDRERASADLGMPASTWSDFGCAELSRKRFADALEVMDRISAGVRSVDQGETRSAVERALGYPGGFLSVWGWRRRRRDEREGEGE